AYELLGQYGSSDVVRAFQSALDHESPLVRRAAVRSVPAESLEQLVEQVAPLLGDPVRTVRIAAALRLLPLDVRALNRTQQSALKSATDEYREQLAMTFDRAGSHVQLSRLAQRSSDVNLAEEELRTAIRIEPYLTGVRSDLAQLLTAAGSHEEEVAQLREEEVKLLQRDIKLLPNSPDIRYRLGLLYYLMDDLNSAESHLAEAHNMELGNYQFLLGLALLQQEQYKRGEEEAFERTIQSLSKLDKLDPRRQDAKHLLQGLIEMQKEREQSGED
ncbi:MAG: HEAT repeat domain-containing protein, partial [Aeoliella sp.]